MFCKYIKLTSGENIIGNTEDACDSFADKEFIEISNPVQVGSMRFPKSGYVIETHIFTPWIAISASTTIKLPTKSIVVVTDVREAIAKQYDNYVNKEESDSLESQEEEGMTMEEFLAAVDESDEEDDNTYDGHTLH